MTARKPHWVQHIIKSILCAEDLNKLVDKGKVNVRDGDLLQTLKRKRDPQEDKETLQKAKRKRQQQEWERQREGAEDALNDNAPDDANMMMLDD
jgi:hypothetical protein